MIRLLAVDIDGTLLDSRGRLPGAHRQALTDASTRGIAIVLVTGRSFHFTLPVVRVLDLPLTMIVNNGAVVKATDGTTLLRNVLPRQIARQVLTGTRAYEDSVALVFDRPLAPGGGDGGNHEERQIVYERMDWTHPHRKSYYDRNKAYIGAASSLTNALVTDDPIQVMFNGSVEPMRTLVRELRAMPIANRFSVAVTEYEARDFSLIDVNAAGCSKGTTLAGWAAEGGIDRQEIMAVGDNLNDIEMLEFAGTAVVMGNATEAVKKARPLFHVTGTNDEEGLAEAIRRFALG
jgi:Cof subfamily protein (haloacid dehalogenase superfamily)